jgi:large subunit ribosomal protein L25
MIAAEPRTIIGKQVKGLRREGLVPAVIYGQREPVNIQLERNLLRRVLKQASTTHLLDVDLNGNTYTVLAREIQQHPTRGDVLHVDFFEVDMKVTIEAEVELSLVGKLPSAIDSLGSAVLLIHAIDIECLPANLISELEIDISAITTPDDVISVSDLVAPPGVTILNDPEEVVAHFEYVQSAASVAAEEASYSVEKVQVAEKGKREDA